jgi:hypothetical protein
VSYVKAEGTVIVSDCPGSVPSGMGAFGAVDVDATLDPKTAVMVLEAQINRFVTPPLPVKGELDIPYRIYLQSILTQRAAAANYASTTLPPEQRDLLEQAFMTVDLAYDLARLPALTDLIKGYGDSRGLPAAKPLPMTATDMNKIIVAGVAIGLFMFARGKK